MGQSRKGEMVKACKLRTANWKLDELKMKI